MLNNLKQYLLVCLVGFIGIFDASAADNMDIVEDVPVVHKWNKPGIPHKGWTHENVEDLEDKIGQCQMCDKQYIRYLHTVSHDESEDLQVGRDCAEKMCEDYETPKKREGAAKNAVQRARRAAEKEEAARVAARREVERRAAQREAATREAARREAERKETIKRDWLNVVKWRQNQKGSYSRTIGEDWINIFKRQGHWKYVFKNQFSTPYASLEQAMLYSYNQHVNK